MEPITLCGAVIVGFGLWLEFESTVKLLARYVSKSRVLIGIVKLVSGQKPVYANRYAHYTR